MNASLDELRFAENADYESSFFSSEAPVPKTGTGGNAAIAGRALAVLNKTGSKIRRPLMPRSDRAASLKTSVGKKSLILEEPKSFQN